VWERLWMREREKERDSHTLPWHFSQLEAKAYEGYRAWPFGHSRHFLRGRVWGDFWRKKKYKGERDKERGGRKRKREREKERERERGREIKREGEGGRGSGRERERRPLLRLMMVLRLVYLRIFFLLELSSTKWKRVFKSSRCQATRTKPILHEMKKT
jgi:hypothetical protein